METHVDSLKAGRAKAFSFQASVSGGGELAHVYVDAHNSARTLTVGLYSSVAGSPGSLLSTGTTSSVQAGAWNTVSLAPSALIGGDTYWLAVLGENGTLRIRDRSTGPCLSQTDAQSGLKTLASSWSIGETSSTCPISGYMSGASLIADPPPPIGPVETTPPVEKDPPAETPPAEKVTPAPTAGFVYTPSAPTVGKAVDFNATSSTCANGPCTYEWSDDGSSVRPATVLWPLGDGQTMSFTFHEAGTKYVRLVVTDAAGKSATVEHNVAVAAESTTPPKETKETTEETVKEEPKEVAKELPKEESKEIVKEEPKEVKKEESSSQTNCIKVPSACGYPDSTNTGVPAGTTLKSQTSNITVTTPGTTIKDVALEGSISVEANNTTIEDTNVTVNGTQAGCSGSCGGRGIWIKPGVTGTVIQNVACHGGALSGSNVTQYCIMSNDSATTIKQLYAYNCTECLAGPMNLSNSFINESDATIPQEHYEDIYYGGGGGPLIVNHNTMLNQQGQTAVVFASVDFGNQTTLTITNNLMAGGGYMIYGGGSGSGGKVVGPVTITGNRFSREFYPNGGYYGVASYMNEAVTTWSGNVWDETLKSVER
ncbi:MAG TPA: PKD domain-containing protein [Solirubrobacteraceae bacterium]|nr:PKD domain-containing protein [Solirubrobacteraceae bacterium]